MTTPDHQQCAVPGHTHPAQDGMAICARGAQRIATMLRDIETETALLDPRKTMGGQGSTRPSGLASQQSPVRLDALVLTDTRHAATTRPRPTDADHTGHDDTPQVLDVLASWAEMVREKWALAWPDRITVVSERALLTRQLPRIVEQTWAGDLHAELADLLAALQRTNGTQDTPAGHHVIDQVPVTHHGPTCAQAEPHWHPPLAPCPHTSCRRVDTVVRIQVPSDCGGVIHHTEQLGIPGFRCAGCATTWSGAAAVRLRHQLWLDELDQAATA